MISGNTNLMKEINMNMLRRIMKQELKATKPQLAKLTGLSVVTINSLIKDLVVLGEIYEDESIPSNGGRPALTYRFNSEYSLALIIYFNEKLGKDVGFISVVNLLGESLIEQEYVFDEIHLSFFDSIVEKMICKYPNIKVVGIGIPGQEVEGRLVLSDYKKLIGENLLEHLHARFHIPIILENDVNAAVSGYCCGINLNEESVVGIYFPKKYPPGAGMFLNGKLLKGKNGMAGEIKFLPIDFEWGKNNRKSDLVEAVGKVIQTITSVINPDRVVIYSETLEKQELEQYLMTCRLFMKEIEFPEIIISRKFSDDFAEGIKQITLKELEPALYIRG